MTQLDFSDILVAIVLVILLIELFISFVVYPYKNGKNFYSLMSEGARQVFQYDKELGYSLNTNLNFQSPTLPPKNAPRRIQWVDVRTDKYGFVTTDEIEKLKNSSKLIFCIGGSTTMGAESRHDRTYPAQLDKLVKTFGYRAINAGVGGYRSIHELLFLKKRILQHQPSAIILFSGYNDFEDKAYNLHQPFNPFMHCLSQSLPNNKLERYLQKSALFFVIKRLIFMLRKKIRMETLPSLTISNLKSEVENLDFLHEWKSNVTEIINICKENKIQVFLLVNASPVFPNATLEEKKFADQDLNMQGMFDIFVKYNEVMRDEIKELCLSECAHYVDPSSTFNIPYKERYSLFVDRMHFSEAGNEKLAKALFDEIKVYL